MRAAPDGAVGSGAAATEALIRGQYEHFNKRRLDEAARRFDPEARIEDVTGRVERGPDGYRRFAAAWLEAFPDAQLAIQSIQPRASHLFDVDLIVSATHTGTLALGSSRLRPSGARLQMRARELFEVRDGLFHLASVTFDLQDLIRQLAPVVDIPGAAAARRADSSARRAVVGEERSRAAARAAGSARPPARSGKARRPSVPALIAAADAAA